MEILNKYPEFENIFNNVKTIKLIATQNYLGQINVDFRKHLYINSLGKIVLLEEAEYSTLNCNLVNSLWFNKNAAISIISDTRQSFEIQVKVERTIVSGKEFKNACEWLADEYEQFDLSSIWIFVPLEIRDTSNLIQLLCERDRNPMIAHLDRIARKEIIFD